jgi:hypothetical protein
MKSALLTFVIKLHIMSTAEIKNVLHRMVVETENREILEQIAALFANLRSKEIGAGTKNLEKNEPIPEFHKAILDERLQNMEMHPELLVPWEQVQKNAEAAL